MQHHAAGIGLVAVARDLPARAEIGEHQLRRRDIAVDAREAALAFDDLLGAVEALLRQQPGEQPVRRRAAGMERLAHGAAVLLHPGRLRGGDAERMRHLLRVEPEQLRRSRTGGDGAERAGEMPAAVVMAGRRLPDAHAGLEARRIRTGERAAVDHAAVNAAALGQREQRREDRRRRMQHDAAHMGVVEVEHVAHLAVGERCLGQAELQLVAEHRRLRLRVQHLQHRQAASRPSDAGCRRARSRSSRARHGAPRAPPPRAGPRNGSAPGTPQGRA